MAGSTKNKRIEARVDAASDARISQAAEIQNKSVSTFIVEAAVSAADHVLGRASHTVMPADQFDRMISALDVPDEASALAELAKRKRRFTRA